MSGFLNIMLAQTSGQYISFVCAGAIDNYDRVTGEPETFIDKPAGIQPGHILFVMHASGGGSVAPEGASGGKWSSPHTVPGAGLALWTRVADGTSNDDYIITARSANIGGYQRTVQMTAFRTKGGESLTFLGTSALAPQPTDDFSCDVLGVGPNPENTLVIGYGNRFIIPWGVNENDITISEPTLEYPGSSAVISTYVDYFVLPDTQPWVNMTMWMYSVQDTSVAMAKMPIPHTPSANWNTRAFFYRFGLTP